MRTNASSWLSAHALYSACVLGGCFQYETHVDVSAADVGIIEFDVPIPEAPETLPTYDLTPIEIERSPAQVKDRCPALRGDRDDAARAYIRAPDGPREPCFTDPLTGDIEVFPDLGKLVEGPRLAPLNGPALSKHAETLVKEAGLTDQVTTTRVDEARVLMHARVQFDADGKSNVPEPAPLLYYVSARRSVGEHRIDGTGSRAAILVGADGAEHGFSRKWKSAARGRDVSAPSVPDVRAQIERQLLATKPRSRVHVQAVEIAYYDGGGAVMQPVYRFVAELGREPNAIGDADHVVGYVPFAVLDEAVPQLAAERFPQPAKEPAGVKDVSAAGSSTPSITVGRFITRNDSKGWSADAEDFWRGLDHPQSQFQFIDQHVLPARSEQFTTENDAFVDSVDIALLEAHGTPWEFATDGNCCDRVAIGAEGFPGYGPLAGGKLKHWILHSCEIVQSPVETEDWAKPWREAFRGGLQSVVGYRSPMYINDGAGAAMGVRLAVGEPVISAWFSAVTTLNAYGLNPSARFRCHGRKDMGKPAAISACGTEKARAGETIKSTTDCLDAWWIPDAVIEP